MRLAVFMPFASTFDGNQKTQGSGQGIARDISGGPVKFSDLYKKFAEGDKEICPEAAKNRKTVLSETEADEVIRNKNDSLTPGVDEKDKTRQETQETSSFYPASYMLQSLVLASGQATQNPGGISNSENGIVTDLNATSGISEAEGFSGIMAGSAGGILQDVTLEPQLNASETVGIDIPAVEGDIDENRAFPDPEIQRMVIPDNEKDSGFDRLHESPVAFENMKTHLMTEYSGEKQSKPLAEPQVISEGKKQDNFGTNNPESIRNNSAKFEAVVSIEEQDEIAPDMEFTGTLEATAQEVGLNPAGELNKDVQTSREVPEEQASMNPDAENLLKQVTENARLYLSEEKSEMVITLKPEHLGKLSLEISSEGGVVTAKFYAENQHVKQVIESNLQTLRDSFESLKIPVQELTVSVGGNNQDTLNQHYQGNNFTGNRNGSRFVRPVLNAVETAELTNAYVYIYGNQGSIDVTA